MACRGFQARGQIGAVAASLQHSHSNTRSKPVNYTIPCSNTRSLTHWVRPGIEPASSWILVGFISTVSPQGNSEIYPLKIFLFLWPYQAKDQIWATVVTYGRNTRAFKSLCGAGDKTSVLALQRCRWSHCTRAGTPSDIFKCTIQQLLTTDIILYSTSLDLIHLLWLTLCACWFVTSHFPLH